jgi:uncharacterized protein YbaR (Trm112 family)
MEKTLLDLLVCPVTKGPLRWDAERQELLSLGAQLAFPVRDGIAIMLENEARALSEDELNQLRERVPPASA